MHKQWQGMILVAVVALFLGATSVNAAEIPFEGHLEKDGTAYTETVNGIEVTFSLYPNADAGTAAIYQQKIAGVKVYGGKFSAIIGPNGTDMTGDDGGSDFASTTLESIVLANSTIYVGLNINAPGRSAVAMAGRQRIFQVPQALNSVYHEGVRLVDIKNHATHAGTVVMWYGPIANIPAGWQLCDNNNNGTPDLQNKFVRGTPANGTGHTQPGGTDTIAQHTHSTAVDLNNFTGSATSDAKSHAHSVDLLKQSASNILTEAGSNEDYWTRHHHSAGSSTSSSHSHDHSVSLNHNHASQTFTSAQEAAGRDNKPGYVALAFICKL